MARAQKGIKGPVFRMQFVEYLFISYPMKKMQNFVTITLVVTFVVWYCKAVDDGHMDAHTDRQCMNKYIEVGKSVLAECLLQPTGPDSSSGINLKLFCVLNGCKLDSRRYINICTNKDDFCYNISCFFRS